MNVQIEPVYGSEELRYRLRQLRVSKNMSQNALSRALGLSRSAVTQWEGGNTQPSLDLVERMAAILNTTPRYIAFGDLT